MRSRSWTRPADEPANLPAKPVVGVDRRLVPERRTCPRGVGLRVALVAASRGAVFNDRRDAQLVGDGGDRLVKGDPAPAPDVVDLADSRIADGRDGSADGVGHIRA